MDKLNDLKTKQEQLQEEMKTEFKSAVDRVSSRFFAHAENEGVCGNIETEIIRCYLDNPSQQLNCASIANDFNKCVNDYRAELLARQG